jgi:MerR family transcriptional regulator/heat shock protein HspR
MSVRVVYKLEIVSELLDVPPSQVRRYEQLGLIEPSGGIDPASSTRVYSEADLRRLRRIRRIQRDLGLSLDAVQVVMRLLDQIEQLQQQLDEGRSGR